MNAGPPDDARTGPRREAWPDARAHQVAVARPVDFGEFVRGAGSLVVQPRMGFGSPELMRAGLAATMRANATTVGTITLDSYTRVGDLDAVDAALAEGIDLNGYPIVTHDPAVTRRMLAGIQSDGFPVQVRHGSAVPRDIFAALLRLRVNATEGGPVSYCLPYGRTPLADSVRNWAECCARFAELREHGVEPHLETFGGCMMGQLCPPSELVAISVLEALFFCRYGLRSISVSYAQQTNAEQDKEAVLALRRLCAELLPVENWHVVVYAYMGVYPATGEGAYRLLGQAAELAVSAGARRLIVKTVAESRRIPTIAENVAALEYAGVVADATAHGGGADPAVDSQTYREASALVHAVLNLAPDIGPALLRAFERGYLDIPYCLHPDNAGRTRSYIDDQGRLRWADPGALPLGHLVERGRPHRVTSSGLLSDLSYVRRLYDSERGHPRRIAPVPTVPDSLEG
ncbi:methylaspartate mutase [Sphaerisporangium dianthi]|uniref:Methylaspartate mutase n=1 Tax=Sphaerisporangium dianthi TaxID=1436120 RepID=A0ABV9CT33_9ACTN